MSFHLGDLFGLPDGIQTAKVVECGVRLMERRCHQGTLPVLPPVHLIHQFVNIFPGLLADMLLLLFVDGPMTHLTDVELWSILIFLSLEAIKFALVQVFDERFGAFLHGTVPAFELVGLGDGGAIECRFVCQMGRLF